MTTVCYHGMSMDEEEEENLFELNTGRYLTCFGFIEVMDIVKSQISISTLLFSNKGRSCHHNCWL